MKEQYQQEMLKIHVSDSLLEKTKLAMKEEEQRLYEKEKKKKLISFGKISLAAAAAAALILLTPAAADYLSTGSAKQSEQIYLAGQEQPEIVRIEAGEKTGFGEWLSELLKKIEEMFR